MKDKNLYQRRTDGDYKGYTEDSFYFNSTEQLWCWKQTSTEKIFKAKTINELIDAESELLSVKVNLHTSKKDMILNYFNIMALEGSLISLFEKYLPNYN